VTAVDRPPDLIVLGPPGSGKSTQAARLARQLGFVHLNPGRRFREQAADDSAIGEEIRELVGEGRLVPDDVTNELVRERLRRVRHE